MSTAAFLGSFWAKLGDAFFGNMTLSGLSFRGVGWGGERRRRSVGGERSTSVLGRQRCCLRKVPYLRLRRHTVSALEISSQSGGRSQFEFLGETHSQPL